MGATGRVASGPSEAGSQGDRRLADPAWQSSGCPEPSAELLAAGEAVDGLIADADVTARERQARFTAGTSRALADELPWSNPGSSRRASRGGQEPSGARATSCTFRG